MKNSTSKESGDTQPKISTKMFIGLAGASLLAGAGAISILQNSNEDQNYVPTRPASQSAEFSPEPSFSAESETVQPPVATLEIQASNPNKLVIPAIGLTALVGSGIQPELAPEEGTGLFYVPKTMDKVDWADGFALPSVPSTGTTYLLGHSNRFTTGERGVFDNLQQVQINDKIIVVTELGKFTYLTASKQLIPFDEIANHTSPNEFGDNTVPDRIVLITCNVPGENANYDGNMVIVANLESAKSLS